MLVTFHSEASGSIMMFGDVARHMFEVMGKDITPKGIITLEQLPDAIARLKAAAKADHAQPHAEDEEDTSGLRGDFGGGESSGNGNVAFYRRAAPLIELMEYSLKGKEPVTWG